MQRREQEYHLYVFTLVRVSIFRRVLLDLGS